MNFRELREKVESRSENEFTVSLFLGDLEEDLSRVNPSGWQEEVNFKLEQLQGLKEVMEYNFMMTCARLERAENDPVYSQATEIATVFCAVLSEEFGVKLTASPIISVADSMAQAGLLEIIQDDGKRFVKLTPQGEEEARRFREAIEEGQ